MHMLCMSRLLLAPCRPYSNGPLSSTLRSLYRAPYSPSFFLFYSQPLSDCLHSALPLSAPQVEEDNERLSAALDEAHLRAATAAQQQQQQRQRGSATGGGALSPSHSVPQPLGGVALAPDLASLEVALECTPLQGWPGRLRAVVEKEVEAAVAAGARARAGAYHASAKEGGAEAAAGGAQGAEEVVQRLEQELQEVKRR